MNINTGVGERVTVVYKIEAHYERIRQATCCSKRAIISNQL